MLVCCGETSEERRTWYIRIGLDELLERRFPRGRLSIIYHIADDNGSPLFDQVYLLRLKFSQVLKFDLGNGLVFFQLVNKKHGLSVVEEGLRGGERIVSLSVLTSEPDSATLRETASRC